MKAAVAARQAPTDRAGLIKGIHAMGRDLQMDQDTRRQLQLNLTGVESCKDMTDRQLAQVYRRVSALHETLPRRTGGGRARTGRNEGQPEELLTVEQNLMINHLFDDLQIAGVGMARMNFCKRVCRAVWPQTRAQGNQIIEALKAMRDRGWKAREETR